MLHRRLFAALLISCTLILSGCSLLEVKLDSQTTPLTQQELNIRILTREYAQQFFSSVEQSADRIAENYPKEDKINQSYVLLWKINAEEGLQQSAYQASPMAALIDTWVFSYQMNAFFHDGAGSDLFNNDYAKIAANQLLIDADELARSLLKNEAYSSTKRFVEGFSNQHVFADLTFIRTPAYRAWLKSNGVDEAKAVSTLGTMPEAMGDVSDRLSVVSAQTPKLMTWKAQLIALNSDLNGAELNETLRSLRNTSESFQDFVENNPQYMSELATQMAIQLQPLVDDIDVKTTEKLGQLTEERIALEAMVERERKALAIIVAKEREKFTQDLDQVSQDVLALAMDKLVEIIKSTIMYFVLFLVAIFFAPLGLGYLLGKRAGEKENSDKF